RDQAHRASVHRVSKSDCSAFRTRSYLGRHVGGVRMTLKFTKWNKGSINKAGLYEDMRLDHYHSRDVCDGISISSSGLRRIFNESPAHYWVNSVYNKNRIVEELSREIVIGRAMHHLVLAEPYFSNIFTPAPAQVPDAKNVLVEWSLRTSYAKEWMAARQREG